MRRIGTLAAMAGMLLLIGGAGPLQNLSRPLPSDASLRVRFREHRREFDALARMALADTQLAGAGHDPLLRQFNVFVHDTPQHDRMLTGDEVRATGRSEIRRLLERAGLPALSRSREGDAVWFVVMSRAEARKGIVYSKKPMTPLRKSLDGLERAGAGYVTAGYVRLAPEWFLFLIPSD